VTDQPPPADDDSPPITDEERAAYLDAFRRQPVYLFWKAKLDSLLDDEPKDYMAIFRVDPADEP